MLVSKFVIVNDKYATDQTADRFARMTVRIVKDSTHILLEPTFKVMLREAAKM